MEEDTIDTVTLAAELTAAWLSNSNTRVEADDVPAFLKSMHETLAGLNASGVAAGDSGEAPTQDYVGAVTARKSLASSAHIISMIDGKPYKTLKRHLSGHGLTPEQYRERYTSNPATRWSPKAIRLCAARWRTRSGLARRAGRPRQVQ